MRADVLIGHYGWIERALLRRALHKTSAASYHNPTVDTTALARHCIEWATTDDNATAPALEWLARQLSMPVHTPHQALGDALTTAGVFLALVHRLEAARGPLTVRELLRLGAPDTV